MKKILLLLSAAGFLLLASCSKQEEGNDQQGPVLQEKTTLLPVPSGPVYDKQKLDQIMIHTLEANNDFQWTMVDLKTIWSALEHSDHTLSIGYKPVSEGDISQKIHKINVKSGAYKAVHDALIDLIVTELNKTASTPVKWSDILVEDDQVLPILTVRLTDKNVLTRLANLQNIRYIEPMDYWPNDPNRSSSGCSASTTSLVSTDYTTISPGGILPWNFNNANVPAAWNVSQGQGITVGVIDAGISSAQPLLGAQFNNGDSNVGRSISTGYTLGSSAYTSCSHGTAMSGQAVGGRNNLGAPVGVAYKSNLHFIRAADDVVLDASSEKTATKNAFIQMGNRSDVRIISLSMGNPFASSVLKDGADYAFNLGKLIFAAAGTSFSWTSWWGVVYPAAYSSCIAVTGVKENGSKCSSCHDGSKVLYTICMERNASSNRNSISLAPSGNTGAYIGGSSCATATAAGIAALVWSARPNLTRTQVQTCLTNTSQFYPTKNSTKGYGNLNAGAAVNYAVANY